MAQPPDARGIRIGTAEREAALSALADHMSAGRLDPDEYGDRVAIASVARFAGELEPLFADLPGGAVVRATGTKAPANPSAATAALALPESDSEAVGGRAGATIVALSPFIALVLFFALAGLGWDYSWLAFLLVPVAGVVVYGPGRHSKRQRDRRRTR